METTSEWQWAWVGRYWDYFWTRQEYDTLSWLSCSLWKGIQGSCGAKQYDYTYVIYLRIFWADRLRDLALHHEHETQDILAFLHKLRTRELKKAFFEIITKYGDKLGDLAPKTITEAERLEKYLVPKPQKSFVSFEVEEYGKVYFFFQNAVNVTST